MNGLKSGLVIAAAICASATVPCRELRGQTAATSAAATSTSTSAGTGTGMGSGMGGMGMGMGMGVLPMAYALNSVGR